MERTAVQWQRFWRPLDAQISLGDDGFLHDPESEWGRFVNRSVQPVNFLSDKPCIVLLGEPGSGKSMLLENEREAMLTQSSNAGQSLIWRDLHEIESGVLLMRYLFDAPEFSEWKRSYRTLVLVLDSLDECRLRSPTLHHTLLNELRNCPTERLQLRIACRTADWPDEFGSGLKTIWKDGVDVLELAPLRRVDVKQAAEERGIDAAAFLSAVHRAGAIPLAIKPLTLEFLLQVFEHDGTLPARQADLYDQGCLRLCEESAKRRETRSPRQLEDRQRLAVAKRIAACTIFANRGAIRLVGEDDDAFEDDLLIPILSVGTERVTDDAFSVNERGIEETLNTGLFASFGPGRLGWAHRTYAEFLAGRYVVDRDLPLSQVMSLIVHPGDPDKKLIPQLHETAAWIAGFRPDVFREILARDPGVLLHSDVARATDNDRARLVSALLEACDAGEWLDDRWGLRRRYAGLKHLGLADQLRPYIKDPDKGAIVRRVAIEIADACAEHNLLGDLLAVALDSSVPVHTRVSAAYAVNSIGDEGSRYQLRDLISTPEEVDPSARLKGCGLRATWPGLLTTKEFLRALTSPQTNFFGEYQSFLYDNPMQHVPTEDLPLALEWAAEHADRTSTTYQNSIDDLIDSVLHLACQHLDVQDIRKGFGNVALVKARHADPLFKGKPSNLLEDNDRRRQVLAAAVNAATDEQDVRLLTWSGLVSNDDALWLLEQHQSRTDQSDEKWARLLRHVLLFDDREAVEAVLEARESDPLLETILSPLFDAIVLESEEAEQQRELYRMRVESTKQDAERESDASSPPTEDIVAPLLEQFWSGDISAWWQINFQLAIDEYGVYVNEFTSDLTELSRWGDTADDTRAALVAAADRYVRAAMPEPENWINSDGPLTIYRPDWAGFRAFRLLLTQDPDRLNALPGEVWARWAQVILAYPTLNPSDQEAPHQELVARAYEHAPDTILATLDTLVDAEQRKEGGSTDRLMWRLDQCWDDRLASFVLDNAQAPDTSASTMDQLLETLLERDSEVGLSFAKSLVPSPLSGDEDERERASIAAALLLKNAADVGWSTVWPGIRADDAFAASVVARIVWDDRHAEGVTEKLTDDQVADLYIRLSEMYPHAEDPEINGVVAYRSSVARWRDDLLASLQHHGTPESCQAIARIAVELPQLEWLKWTLLNARTFARQRTWNSPQPEDILALTQLADVRFVQSNEQLLDVIVESLVRLEEKLQRAEPPRAVSLWDYQADTQLYRPKNEERLSDYIKGHLDDDLRDRGILLNREVENRHGEKTDVRVEARERDRDGTVIDVLTVVIEVKGCWHRELNSAMETQLVGRYLSNNNTNHGLYVVGWYNCDKWDETDSRKRRAPKHDRDEAQRRLDAQAADLSRDGTHVRALVLDTALRY